MNYVGFYLVDAAVTITAGTFAWDAADETPTVSK